MIRRMRSTIASLHPDLLEYVGGYHATVAPAVGSYELKKNTRDHLIWLHPSEPRVHCIQFLDDNSWGVFCRGEVLTDEVAFEVALETAYEEMVERSAGVTASTS
mgnify:CR=1 FL=1